MAGLVVVRQRPRSARGVIFLTLEDEVGFINVAVFPRVADAHRAAVRLAPLVLVEGTLEVEGGLHSVRAARLRPLGPLDLESLSGDSP